MKARTVLISCLCLLACLSGCSDDSQPIPDGGLDQGPPAEGGLDRSSADRRGDRGPLPDAAIEAQFCGTLVDSTGAPVAKGDIIICNEHTCYNGTADEAGAFCVAADEANDYLFHGAEKVAGGKHYADVFFPLVLSAAELAARAKIQLGTIVQPLVTKVVPLDPKAGGVLDLGGSSIKLTVAAGSAKLGLKTSAEVGAAEVPLAKINPRLLATRAGSPSPILTLALVPFDVGFTPAANLELFVPISASPASLDIFHVDDQTGKLTAAGTATVITGKLQASLPVLGWYLFYPKQGS